MAEVFVIIILLLYIEIDIYILLINYDRHLKNTGHLYLVFLGLREMT